MDGVSAEVLYTTFGMPLFRLPDADLQRACFKVYNDWVAEFCVHDPARFHGIALVSLEDLAAGVQELERCAKLGMKGGSSLTALFICRGRRVAFSPHPVPCMLT